MSHTKTEPLATKNSDDVLEMRHVSPFWAVMLAGRDHDHMVNMRAFLDEYKFNHPSGRTYGNLRSGSLVKVTLPFLTNTRLLAVGELLVLPFNACLNEIFCESYPPLAAISHTGA